jgi:ABC-2 type transport system permease protein
MGSSGYHLRFFYQMRAEWVKLRSVRSTWVCLGLIILLGVGLGGVISFVTASAWAGGGADRLQYDPVRTAQAGVLISQFCAGVLGALFVTGEYSSGLLRSTLSAVSHRGSVLLGKACVLTLVLLLAGEVSAFGSYFFSRWILLRHGGVLVLRNSVALQLHSAKIPVLSLSAPGVVRATLLVGVYVALLGLLGVGLGFIMRSGAGAIATYVGVLLIIPVIVSLLPSSASGYINEYLPSTLGSAMLLVTLHHNAYGGNFVGPLAGAGILTGYALLVVGLGWWRLSNGDA